MFSSGRPDGIFWIFMDFFISCISIIIIERSNHHLSRISMSANDVGKGFLQLCVTPRLMLLHHTLYNIVNKFTEMCVTHKYVSKRRREGLFTVVRDAAPYAHAPYSWQYFQLVHELCVTHKHVCKRRREGVFTVVCHAAPYALAPYPWHYHYYCDRVRFWVQHEEGSRGGKYLGSLHCTEQHFSEARVWSILARAVS